MRLTKNALLLLYSLSKRSITLSKLRFLGFRKPKNNSFFNLSTKEGNPVYLGCPLLSYVSRYFVLFFFMKSMISEIYPNAMPTTVSAAP